MEKAKIYLFTSPTCPNCPPAKKFINEFKSTREDFYVEELSTISSEGQKMARKYDVMAVPTFIIKGPGFPDPIGLVGVQSRDSMNKYIDIALGKRSLEEPKKEKKPFEFKIGKLRIKF